MDIKTLKYKRFVVILSLLLLLMVIPHTLEDFAVGEPAKNDIPLLALQSLVAVLIAIQALGLYYLGNNYRRGYVFQMVVGLIWPMLAGIAQLPAILSRELYRLGAISIFFVIGIIVIGVLLLLASLGGLLVTREQHK